MRIEAAYGIHLTEIRRSDQDALIEYLNEPDIYATTVRIPFPYTPADAQEWFALVEKLTAENGQPFNWAIRDDAGKLIGDINFEREAAERSRSHRAEVGYWLAKPFWGRGIMTAVVAAACRQAVATLELTRITANVFSFNAASARVLEKCGFEQEGYLKKHYFKDGQFIDAKAYGLVK